MKKKNKIFIVTCGTGFIGSNICKMLVREGHKVIVYDNNFRGNLEKISQIKKKNNIY
jgi:UDP-glucose 4-epimerase